MPPSPLRWTFHSPARLALVSLAVVATVVGGVLLATPEQAPRAHDAERSASPSTARPTVSAPSPTPVESATKRDRAAAASTAREFAEAWTQGGTVPSKATWLRALRPVTTTTLLRGLKLTDPKRLPPGPVTNVRLRQIGAFGGQARVWLGQRSAVDVQLVTERRRWVVADVRPAER